MKHIILPVNKISCYKSLCVEIKYWICDNVYNFNAKSFKVFKKLSGLKKNCKSMKTSLALDKKYINLSIFWLFAAEVFVKLEKKNCS